MLRKDEEGKNEYVEEMFEGSASSDRSAGRRGLGRDAMMVVTALGTRVNRR